MIGRRLYPRLAPDQAEKMRRVVLSRQGGAVFDPADLEEQLERADVFPPTGGERITLQELVQLRERCLDAVPSSSMHGHRAFDSTFDREVGRALFHFTRSSRGEMGAPMVWDFLTLVLLPDVALQRFDGEAKDSRARFTGGNRRHVLQRLWKRRQVFGDQIVDAEALTEDDYVALLERRLTLERGLVARHAAASIIRSGFRGSARRAFTRSLMRQLVQASGYLYINGDDDDHLQELFAHLGRAAADGVRRGA